MGHQQKYVFKQNEIAYLDYKIDKDDLSSIHEKLEAIVNVP